MRRCSGVRTAGPSQSGNIRNSRTRLQKCYKVALGENSYIIPLSSASWGSKGWRQTCWPGTWNKGRIRCTAQPSQTVQQPASQESVFIQRWIWSTQCFWETRQSMLFSYEWDQLMGEAILLTAWKMLSSTSFEAWPVRTILNASDVKGKCSPPVTASPKRKKGMIKLRKT